MKLSTLPIYDKQIEVLQNLPDEQFAHIVKAMFAYSQDEELPKMDVLEQAVFELVKISIDATKAKAEGGARGGSKTQAKGKQDEGNAKQEESIPETDTKDDSSMTEASAKHRSSIGQAYAKQLNNEKMKNEEVKNEKVKKLPRTIARESDFEELWDLYPRKQGRKEALEAFKRAIRDGDTVDEIRTGIRNYSEFILRNKTEARYIKQGSTYFRQRAWKDSYDLPTTSFDYSMRADDMSDVLAEL